MSNNHPRNKRPFSRPTKRCSSDQEHHLNCGLSGDSTPRRQFDLLDGSRSTQWRQAKKLFTDPTLDLVLEVLESDDVRSSTLEASFDEQSKEKFMTPVTEIKNAMNKADEGNAVPDIESAAVGFTAGLPPESSLQMNIHCQKQDDFDEMEADDLSLFQGNDQAVDHSFLERNDYEEQDYDFDDTEVDDVLDVQENGDFDKESKECEDAQYFSSQESDEPLYFGAKITVIESIISILVFFLRHSLTLACLADLLTLINFHCPSPNFCKKSVYLFKKFLAFQQPMSATYYCNSCYSVHKNSFSVCPDCKSEQRSDCNFISQMSATEQLKTIIERPGVLQSIHKNKCKHSYESEIMCDVYDGSVYRNFKDGRGSDFNVTFMWFTDGAALFKSSNISLWPLYLAINELPFKERFKPQNLILVALWVGEQKPEMNIFFKCCEAFSSEIEKGVKVFVDGQNFVFKGKILCGTCDLPAKCSVLNMKQFNGSYGCAKCLQKGETFFYKKHGSEIHRSRTHVYPFESAIDKPKRTHDQTIIHAKEAFQTHTTVYGIKGPSQLCLYVPDIINSTGIDYMHGVCLGVMRKVLFLLLDPSFSKCDFSISKFRNVVDKNMCSIAIPNMLQRAPRSVNLLKQWKASEFKNFLLYYSIPVFSTVLKKRYYEHHMLLVVGIAIMLKKEISKTELDFAEHALWQYVYLFERLYGKEHMSANVHNLLHLADNVRNLGPLWTSSCFGWENVNGSLLKYVHGTQYVQTQINAAVSIHLSLPVWIEKIQNVDAKNFCKNLQKSERFKITEILNENTYVIGKMCNCSEQETNQLLLLLGEDFKNGKIYHRMIIKDLLFSSYAYSKTHKKKSCYVKYRQTNGTLVFGCIHYFVKLSICKCENFYSSNCTCEPDYLCIVQKYKCLETICSTELEKNVILNHIAVVSESEEYELISYEQLLSCCIYYKLCDSGKIYISELVNLLEME